MENIFEKGIRNAKMHGINVSADEPNKGEGDCLFESVIDNINHRDCFKTKLSHPVQYYREKWVSEMQLQFQETDHYPGEDNHDIWNTGWEKQKEGGEYNVNIYNISDIVPAAMGHCVQSNILVFNVDKNSSSPAHIFKANYFQKNIQPTTEIPLVLVYNGGHYESLLPKTQNDSQLCTNLVAKIANNEYDKTKYGFSTQNRESLKRKEISSEIGYSQRKKVKALNQNEGKQFE